MMTSKRLMVPLLAAVLVLLMVPFVSGYTDPANMTGASLDDVRVDPSEAVAWTPGAVLNSTGLPVGGGNSSLSFDGVNQCVLVANDASLQMVDAVTFGLWMKYNSGAHPISKIGSSSKQGYEFYTTSNKLKGVINTAGGSFLSPQYIISDALWHHYMCVWGDNKLYLFVDGVQQGTFTATTNVITIDSTYGVTIGARRSGYGCVNATIDEVHIYNRAFSPTEIAQHYQGIYLNDTGLVLYLDFDGEALDQSGEGNDGTLQNGPAYTDGWASVPVSTYYNGTISVDSRRILVNSTTGTPLSTIPDTAPVGVGVYTAELAPDNSIQNGTINGFTVDRYEVYLEAQYEETEAGMQTLLTAQGASAVDGHTLGSGDSFTINGVAFTWNTYTSNFTGTTVKSTPQTVTFGTTITGTEATYGITNFSANNTAVVTWTTGTLDRLQSYFVTGDWIGAAFGEIFLVTGQIAGYTIILAIFSLAAYQYSGPYAVFMIWLFGWGVFITQVHGLAQQMAVLLFVVGVGLALAKLINDRRNA